MRKFQVLPYRQDLPEVSALSGWVSPGWRPYPGDYDRAFASSGIPYPLHLILPYGWSTIGWPMGWMGLTTFRWSDADVAFSGSLSPGCASDDGAVAWEHGSQAAYLLVMALGRHGCAYQQLLAPF